MTLAGHGVGRRDAEPIVLLGASNIVAARAMARLVEAGRPVLAVARRPIAATRGIDVLRLDLDAPDGWSCPRGATVLSILPLAVLARALPCIAGAASIVAVGSTSIFGKATSPDSEDRAAAASLAAAETAFERFCEAREIPWTVLRPTLVYDGVADRNVARLARTIRRLGFLPMAAPATGLRQPIHADDVALALVEAANNPAARGNAFNIAGGEILTYRAMVERIFNALGRRPRLLPIPARLVGAAFGLAPLAAALEARGLSRGVFARMNEDLVFDVAPGRAALGLDPRPFILPDLRDMAQAAAGPP